MIRLNSILHESTYNDVESELKKFDSNYNRADDKRSYDMGKQHHERIMDMARELSPSEITKLEKKYGVKLKANILPQEKPFKPVQIGDHTITRNSNGFKVVYHGKLSDFTVQDGIQSIKDAMKITNAAQKETDRRKKLRGESTKLKSMMNHIKNEGKLDKLSRKLADIQDNPKLKKYYDASADWGEPFLNGVPTALLLSVGLTKQDLKDLENETDPELFGHEYTTGKWNIGYN